MGYKYRPLDAAAEQHKLADTPNYLLKVIPHVDGSVRDMRTRPLLLRDVQVTGAWKGRLRSNFIRTRWLRSRTCPFAR